ncbi:hypothetical protein FNF27_06527 [Cafeteria roenbergensis]|uniref:Fungal lipase-type domain-containing protein n=1 Tax=Cafeteria roenbergensis TaxID=33653 RepID=A0A5A8DZM9_CAFRO|nr:hypothetical protein FNF27_06527 [Cafeteria roenbergensis]
MRSIVASAALAFAALASTVSAGSFSESDAKSMVYLAGAAYCDASALRSWSCGQACNGPLSVVPGTITVVQNSSMDLQAYVGQLSDGRAIVSFRGTQPSKLADWIDDLKSAFHTDWQGPGCPGCRMADGFYRSYLALAPAVKVALNGIGAGTVVITGHSLGAGMAGIAMLDLHTSGFNLASTHYTFGHPRDGDNTYASTFNSVLGSSRLFRVVHYKDIVPHLPFEWMGFHHSPREVWFNEAQTSYQVCDGTGEDPNCSDSLTIAASISDHLDYLNLPISNMC